MSSTNNHNYMSIQDTEDYEKMPTGFRNYMDENAAVDFFFPEER